jgi:hypothetical protein
MPVVTCLHQFAREYNPECRGAAQVMANPRMITAEARRGAEKPFAVRVE